MLHRILHLGSPMIENFAFVSLEDALDDLIEAWEEGDVDLTGIIGVLHAHGLHVAGLDSDADICEDTPISAIEAAGVLARGLIATNAAAQESLRAAIAVGAGILVLSVTDPWFDLLAGICDRRDVSLPPYAHPDPSVEAAVSRWLRLNEVLVPR